jgi:peptide deformylase
MSIRRVLKMGHPLLRQPARSLEADEIGSPVLAALLEDMVDTLHDYGGIGLAAPQVGESIRLAIIEIAGGPSRYGELEDLPLSVFVNPFIEVLDESTEGYWEGCLSVPGLRGFVERPQHIKVNYTTLEGDDRSMELNGFTATVFQHEFDHLDGKLFVDRMTELCLVVFARETARYHQ